MTNLDIVSKLVPADEEVDPTLVVSLKTYYYVWRVEYPHLNVALLPAEVICAHCYLCTATENVDESLLPTCFYISCQNKWRRWWVWISSWWGRPYFSVTMCCIYLVKDKKSYRASCTKKLKATKDIEGRSRMKAAIARPASNWSS